MSVDRIEEQIANAQAQAQAYQEQIRTQKEHMADTTLTEYSRGIESLPRNQMRVRRVLKGHANKIFCVQWSVDSSSLVSASQDGKMLVWDPHTADKEYAITLKSSWVMTCGYSPSKRMVASGGLDNVCSIYSLADVDVAMDRMKQGIPEVDPRRELYGHSGFITACKFLSEEEILTSSGDTTSILWDVEKSIPKMTFRGHTADIMNISLISDRSTPGAAQSFVSVGCDATARVWDIRSGECVRIFVGHESDINAVDVFPSGMAFATGSDDSTCRLYDLRADRELMRYSQDGASKGPNVTSVSFSRSGRGLFAAYDDTNVIVWDTIKAEQSGLLAAHDQRVSCLSVSPSGQALATGSWDTMIKLWA